MYLYNGIAWMHLSFSSDSYCHNSPCRLLFIIAGGLSVMTYAQKLKCNRKRNIINLCHTRKQNECTRIWNVVLANWKVLAKEVVNLSHGIRLVSWKTTYSLKISKSVCYIWKPLDIMITLADSHRYILIINNSHL